MAPDRGGLSAEGARSRLSLYQACVDTDEAEAEVSRERARSVVKEEETKESANERCQATEEVESHM